MSSIQSEQAGQHPGTYIYCVTRAQALDTPGSDAQVLDVPGLGGEPVRAVKYSDLAAVVSDSPFDDYDVTRENLTTHEQVVERVMQQADVLPVSFGTVATDDQAVQQVLLEAAAKDLHQALDVVHGRFELWVKVIWEKDRLFAELSAEDESIRALHDQIAAATPEETYDERTQLGELISTGIERKRDQEAAAVLSALHPLAADVRVNENYADLMVLNASFLVDKQQIPAFEDRVRTLGQEQAGRLIVQYTGPLPPYNFVSIVAGGEGQNVEVAR